MKRYMHVEVVLVDLFVFTGVGDTNVILVNHLQEYQL